MPALGPVSGKALASSVTAHVGGSEEIDVEACRRLGPGVRRCPIYDAASSGEAIYRVELRGYHCWRATRVRQQGVEVPLAAHATGCVKLADQLRLVERLLDAVSLGRGARGRS